jgi:hypothetical protein
MMNGQDGKQQPAGDSSRKDTNVLGISKQNCLHEQGPACEKNFASSITSLCDIICIKKDENKSRQE